MYSIILVLDKNPKAQRRSSAPEAIMDHQQNFTPTAESCWCMS